MSTKGDNRPIRTGNEAGAENRKRGPWKVVFVIALIVFIISVASLAAIGLSYLQGQHKYDHIAETSSFDASDTSDDTPVAQLSVDWEALRSINPDTVGWVYIPNTPVNYPIVQGPDNYYYLDHDFEGDQGWLAEIGAIFLEATNNPDWTDACNFVFGHHLNDGSMFAALGEIRSPERMAECSTVYLLTPGGNYKLKAFSLVHCNAAEEIVVTKFDNEEQYVKYVQSMIDRSEFRIDGIPEAKDMGRLFAFATCDNTYQSQGRYVLFCHIEDTSTPDLVGTIGITTDDDGATNGLSNDVGIQSQ